MRLAGISVAAFVARAAGLCNMTDVQKGTNHGGKDYARFASDSAEDCQQHCCADGRCGAFTWTSYQPHGSGSCSEGTACCWLKLPQPGAFSDKDNCTSGEVQQPSPSPMPPTPSLMSPRLTQVSIIANDTTGNLRDPSGMIRDPKTGRWHFWVVYIPGHTKPGWGGYLQHWSSDSIEGPWANGGIAMNHSSDPEAWDYHGLFSPSALYDDEEDLWFLFYSGTGANYTGSDPLSAQLVASAASPEGPWTRLGVVTYPTGSEADHFNQTWNARRCDSGRALKINGTRGYWTKGCQDIQKSHTCAEGAYFPKDASSFKPPYAEWTSNPIFRADGSAGFKDGMGYENCEFFLGPKEEVEDDKRLLHVLCQGHTTGQPHFVADPTNLHWTFVEMLHTGSALEPTPVYHSGMPGDEAEVSHFIARTSAGGRLVVGLYRLDWVKAAEDSFLIV